MAVEASGCSGRSSSESAIGSFSRRSSPGSPVRASPRQTLFAGRSWAPWSGCGLTTSTSTYLHRPDPEIPIGDTLGALDELVRSGKVRAIGCSNFSAEQLADADRVAREHGTARFTVLQNHYNLLHRDDDEDVLPLCRELGVAYVPYFPLASGLLTGKYRRGQAAPEGARLAGRVIDEDQFDRVEALARFAEEQRHTLHELAIAALASTAGVASVIAGATRPEQVRANAAAASWALSVEDLDALRAV